MSFIATPPPQHTWAEPEPAHEIPNDGFFPSVDPVDVRNTIRINGTVTEARLIESVHDAIATVNRGHRRTKAAPHLKMYRLHRSAAPAC